MNYIINLILLIRYYLPLKKGVALHLLPTQECYVLSMVEIGKLTDSQTDGQTEERQQTTGELKRYTMIKFKSITKNLKNDLSELKEFSFLDLKVNQAIKKI